MLRYIAQMYPSIRVKFKEESSWMSFLSVMLFFHKDFMTKYSTVWGNTIYFPSRKWLREDPIRAYALLIHELNHLFDRSSAGKIKYNFLYYFPQVLGLLFFPLHALHYDILSYIMLIFLLPFPSPRAYYEKRAYMAQLYALYHLHEKFDYTDEHFDLAHRAKTFGNLFNSLDYYFMLPCSLKKEFEQARIAIERGEKPFDSQYFIAYDNILNNVKEEDLNIYFTG